MPKFVRNIILAILAFVAIALVTVVIIASRIDPNDFKPQIIEQTQRQTGLKLSLAGDMSWKFFPSVALKIEDVEAHTEKRYAGDTLFAAIKTIAVQVDLVPLLTKTISVDNVLLDGIQLRLATDKKGHSNWKDIESQAPADNRENKEPQSPDQHGVDTQFILKQLSLHDIEVNVIDLSADTNQTLAIQKLSARNLNIEGKNFPLEANIVFKDRQQNQQVSLSLSSMMALDLQQSSYRINELQGKFDQSKFSGSAEIELGKQTRIVSTLAFDTIDLNNYIDFSESESQSTYQQGSDTATSEPFPLDILHTLNTQLELSINKLIADKTILNDVALKTSINDGRLNVSELSAKVYGGSISQSLQIDANHEPARWQAKQSLNAIDVAQLLESRDIDVSFSGMANLDSSMTMRGNTFDSLQQTTSGKTSFSLNQGVYGDDNIELRICQAIALVRNEKLSSNWPQTTSLNDTTAQINWNNGIGKITSLSAGLPNASIQGDGTINLIKQNLDLRLRANVSGETGAANSQAEGLADFDPGCAINKRYRNIQWPLRCKANADKSSCGVDNSRLDKILTDVAKDRAKEKLSEELNERLGEGVGDVLRGLFK